VPPVISSAAALVCACNSYTVCGLMRYTRPLSLPQRKQSQVLMSGEHVGRDDPHPKRSANRFDRTRLPNTSSQDVKADIRCMWVCTILLGKNCIHVPCHLNDLTLHLLTLTKIGPISICLRLHTTRYTLHDSAWIFRCPEPKVLLAHESVEVEMVITKPQAV